MQMNKVHADTTLPTAEEDDVSNLTILSKAKLFVTENNINEDNIHQYSSVFVAGLSTTPAERELVSQMTVGQDNNDFWHEKPLYQAKNFGKIQVRMFVKIYFYRLPKNTSIIHLQSNMG